jgi:hypothetical protein
LAGKMPALHVLGHERFKIFRFCMSKKKGGLSARLIRVQVSLFY